MRELTDEEKTRIKNVVQAEIANQYSIGSAKVDGANLTFVVTGGVESGLDAIEALKKAGLNTRGTFDANRAPDNGVTGADGARRQEVWIRLIDPDGPLFKADAEPALA